MPIRIVTDTACDLPYSYLREHRIRQVASTLTLDGRVFPDDHRLSNDDFYRRLSQVRQAPQTTDATVEDLAAAYADLLAESPGETIFSIHLSSKLGETVNNARTAAAQFPDARIRIIDTRQVSVAEGLMVIEAARRVEQGASESAILNRLTQMSNQVAAYFIVDTLDYLALLGRVSVLERFFGSLVGVRPVLKIEAGEIAPYQNLVTRARALAALRDLAIWQARDLPGLRIIVGHARCPGDAQRLAEDLRSALHIEEVTISEFGPSIGVATGPGALGVAWAAGG